MCCIGAKDGWLGSDDSGNDRVERYVSDCRAVNALAGRTVSSRLVEFEGVKTTTPGGAFYL